MILRDVSPPVHSLPLSELGDHVQNLLGSTRLYPVKLVQFLRTNFGPYWLGEQFKVSVLEHSDLVDVVTDMTNLRTE